MNKQNILVVDDEEDILELIRYNLAKEGYNVRCASSGEEACAQLKLQAPDLVVLDIMLPGVDGLEVCKIIKSAPETLHIPVIMLTAKGEEIDVVSGLEIGADDYITKPFSPRILLARVRAALRKKQVVFDQDTPLRMNDLVIHPGRHEVVVQGKPINLTLTEFRLLHFLARRPGWVFTRYQIVDGVKGDDYPVTDRSVDVQVVGLRKKLGDFGRLIETVRGVGYRFREQA